MKNQYVGDIGDYGKYGLLRFLTNHGIKIGINWYLTEDDGSSDGRHTGYLNRPEEAIYVHFAPPGGHRCVCQRTLGGGNGQRFNQLLSVQSLQCSVLLHA